MTTVPASSSPGDRIIAALHGVAGASAALHAPEIAGNEWAYVKECLDTEWVSSVGAYVDRFERDLSTITGARFAIATVNGTAALQIAMLLAGVARGDEVIIPSLTFVATANAVAHCGAVPHFADIEPTTLGLDAAGLEAHLSEIAERLDGLIVNRRTGRPIRALVCMHTFGHPCDLDGLSALAARWGIPLVEDAAESLGSTRHGRHTGTTGLLSALSFNGNKIVTTGGGGAILTNDETLAKRAKHLTTTAKLPHPFRFDHDEVGYNYRLPNLNAALGVAQLEQLPGFLARKRVLAERYAAAFAEIAGVRFFSEPAGCRSNYWLNVLLLDRPDRAMVERIIVEAGAQGLQCRPAWTPMHRLPMYAHCPRMALPVTDDLDARLINLPSSPRLADGPRPNP